MKALTNSSLKWSSPKLFNDPFDHRLRFVFPFNKDDLIRELCITIEKIVYGDEINIITPTPLSSGLLRIRSIRDQFPKDKFLDFMNAGAIETADKLSIVQDKMNFLYQDYLINSRILCVSETIDNIVMWSHYANEHRGVVLRLQCIDEIDNTLLAARKVTYQTDFPSYLNIESYIRHQTGEDPRDIVEMLHELPFIKHSDWGYEKEWRVFYPFIHEPQRDGSDLWTENRRVFGAAFLGCRMESIDESRVLQTIDTHMPHMEVFKSVPLDDAFGLRYEQIR